jgi:thioredoxin-related protein
VLVEVDFPHGKQQSAALKKANGELQAKYKINGFPTMVVLNGEGKELGELEGYMDSKAFISKLEELRKKS